MKMIYEDHITWAREAEVSPLLEAVAREWLVKTQQAGKKLGGHCADLWILEIEVAL
jgi:hypothetical protein